MKNLKKIASKLLAAALCLAMLFTAVQIPFTVSAAELINLLPNGTFDSDVTGWKCSNSSWGTLAWNEDAAALSFTKVSASSGPAVYSEVVKATKGARVHLSYDYKTSVALSGVATSVYFYAYTADYVEQQSTTHFNPTGSNYSGEFVDTKTDWQTKELTYTLPADCEYVQIQLAFRGAVAANTVLTVDNVSLYEVNENYVLSKISTAVSGNDSSTFKKWIGDAALSIENLNTEKYTDYFTALKLESEITKETIQTVVDSFISTEPKSLIANGTFDSDVSGWKLSNSSWGTTVWNETDKLLEFTKTSASSGPSVYTEVIKVASGDEVYLEYDYKTSAALTSTATSVYIYAYTSELVESKGNTAFAPTGDEYTYEFVDTTTQWQTKNISYTVPEDCEYVQVVFGFRGGVAANTVWSLDNISLYKVDENYLIHAIKEAVKADDLSSFNIWIRKAALGLTSLNPDKFADYFADLKERQEITKEVIQQVVDSYVVEGEPVSLLPNGSFAADVNGWKVSNAAYGTLAWNSSEKAAELTKVSATSGPTFYTELVKVTSGNHVCLNYDFKTSAALTGTATVVYVYAYTSEFVESKGTTYFNPTGSNYTYEFADSTTEWQSKQLTYTLPTGCEYVQVVFGFRGAVAANTVLSIDNVKLYDIDADFALYKISQAVEAEDRFDLMDWMQESALGLENVTVANRRDYLSELSKVTETLTKNKVQEIVDTVNTACSNKPILENGSFDTTILPWREFSATTPSAIYSAIDGGCASITKENGTSSYMLSEVVEVAYGDILHLEFTVKASTDAKLTLTKSQFTKDELRAYGDDAGQSGKEAATKESEIFDVTAEEKTYIVDIKITGNIYGFVAAFSLESGAAGDVVYIDNIVLSRGTEEFVNQKLNSAIVDGDMEAFKRWMKHVNAGLVYEAMTVNSEFMQNLKTARESKGANLTADEITDVSKKTVTDIGTRLELFVDDTLIDTKNTTADLVSMTPKYEGQVLNCSGGFVCDNIAKEIYTGTFDPSRITEDTRPWESLGSSYATVLKVGDKYYCYYRGVDEEVQTVDRYVNGYGNHDPSVAYYLNVCVAESTDGVNWTRPEFDLYDFNYQGENLKNNIIIGDIMENLDGRHLCSFSAIKNESPNANPEKPYIAMMVTVMSRGWGFDLFALESADGIHWDYMNSGEPVISNGRSDIMDSQNVVLWSEEDQEFKMYFRMWHDHPEYGQQRGISVISSKDFINWDDIDTEAIALDYYSDMTDGELAARNEGYNGTHPDNYQFYTNGMFTYDRAPHIYIGIPTRYLGNSAYEVAPYLAASRDGVNYKLWDTMLIEPSAELGRDGNRSNYADSPIFRTSETEYSFFAHRGFKDSGMIYDRFSFRVDGFVSAVGDAEGKTIVTTPITFDGDGLILNYKAPEGTVRAQLTDIDGNPLEGFTYADCTALTGDSIELELSWTGDLTTIDEPVKISFELVNAELYSYKFACIKHSYDNDCDTTCNTEGCGNIREPKHDAEHRAETETTPCQSPGVKEHWFCEGCTSYFTDEACTNEVEYDTLLKLDEMTYEHKYDNEVDKDCNWCFAEREITGKALVKGKDGVWYYYVDGEKSNDRTLVKKGDVWFFVENGVWNKTATTLVKYEGIWFYVENGRWNKTATTLVKYEGVWFYVENGRWNKTARTLVKYEGIWFFVNNGRWDKTSETVVKYNNVWFYVNGGRWVTDAETLVKYSGNWLYIKNGRWSNTANTYFTYKNVKFKIVNGVAQV